MKDLFLDSRIVEVSLPINKPTLKIVTNTTQENISSDLPSQYEYKNPAHGGGRGSAHTMLSPLEL